jgi:hemerythrin-like metal-binding protein
MELVKWESGYELGIKEIDEQHRKLVDILNEVIHLKASGAAARKFEQIIEDLVDYTDYHFKTEEQYMERCGYEGLVEHRRVHDGFSDRLRVLYLNTTLGDAERTDEVLDFLKRWLLHHIMKTDRDYVGLMKEKGLN